uniref:Uncharacterized protein n=1 Tax=CrAss-like virus sp. ctWDt29 TaxID=2825836 RepID=A0A8S5NUE2_9CAUD|nr:MAG TPA: hypothetical protein [CrAss-like virus sp. ctWDt29]
MPIEKIRGLRGLKGLDSLSPEERDAFMKANANVLDQYHNLNNRDKAANILYMNQKYINTFGLDAFNLNNDGTEDSFNFRNKQTKAELTWKAFEGAYGKDDNFNELATFLDTDGMYDLLNNDEYLGKTKIRNKFIKNINDSKAMQKAYDSSLNIPYTEAAFAKGIIRSKTAINPYEQKGKDEKRDKEILDKLYAESQQRREKDIQGDANIMYANMLDADTNGQKNIASWLKDFDKMASKNSNYYFKFKNSSWLKDYDDENKLKDYAKYQALKQKYGEGVALQYLDRDIQNRIAEAQDGKFTGNTLKGVLTTAWSDIGSDIALFANMKNWYDVDRMAIINQGKDPDKPIYDKKGKIVDYKRNENIWTNPDYWNNVYKYNTFSPTEIKAIEEKGGISTDVNVREYGYTPDFFSWDTVQEGFKQSGHFIEPLLTTALTGGAGRLVGMGANAAMKGVGLSAKAMQTANKAGRVINDVLVRATTGLSGSQLEAMGTFDEQMETAKQKIREQINSELHDYQRSIDYNSKESKAALDYYYKQLKIKDNRRVASGSREGMTQLPMSDETLKAQAKQMYTNQLLGAKQKELEELHKKDEMEAARAATKAYMTNFALDCVKNIPLTTAVQKFLIAKGSMRGAFDNTIDKNIIADIEKGGVKRAVGKGDKEIRFSSGKGLAKEIGKQFAGGFADEYLDGINASFAGGVGSNVFDNYMKRNYDPEAYDSTVDSFAGNFLAGLSEGMEGITDRQNLYEGFIGMVSPMTTVAPNMNAVFHPKDTWNAVLNKKDVYGNKINFAERVSSVLMNPLLNTIAEARQKDRRIDNTVEAINRVVAANKDKLDSAAKTISVLNNFNTPVNGNNPMNILDYKDNKLLNAFTLIKSLNELEDIGGTKSKLYEDTMHTIQGLAEGTLSEEEMSNEVDKFIADPDNKSILDGNEDSKKVAAERLQKNAKYFMDMKKKVDEIQQMFANSPSMKNVDPRVAATLVYNTVAKDDYKNRLESILNELGTGSADTESTYTPNYAMRYDTKNSIKKAVAAREKEVAKADKEIEELSASNGYARTKIQQLEKQLENTTKEGERITIKEDIRKYNELIDSQNFQIQTLRESKDRLLGEKEDISKIGEGEDNKTSFTVNDILNADVRDMAYILDPKNKENFSKKKQAVIDKTIARLKQKDPEALRKINDAGILVSRIDDMETVYNKISNNDKLASTYFDAAEQSRGMAAWGESIQREIKKRYKDISDAYQNREENPEAFRNKVLEANSEVVEAYMNDHPKQAEAIKPYYDMLKFNDDVAAILNNSNYRYEDKMMVAQAIDRFQNSSNTMEEFMTKMENVIDTPDMYEGFVSKINEILSKVEQLGYLRDATIIENRKQRKEREAEEAKKKEEEKKKVDEAAKNAAEKKVAEEKDKQEKQEDMGEVPGKNDNWTITGDVDLSMGEEPSEEPQKDETNNEKTTAPVTQNVKTILGDGSGDMSITAGEMWNGTGDNAKKGKFTMTKMEGEISFDTNDKHDVLSIASDEYEVTPETSEHEENAVFEASSMKKKGDDWYFVGNFVGTNKTTEVKAKKSFDIEKAIERQQKARETELAAKGTDVGNVNIIDNGDSVQGVSASIDAQINNTDPNGKEVHMSETNVDADDLNGTGEHNTEANVTTLSGNAMSRYEPDPLAKDGKLVNKKGKDDRKQMDEYYAWMDAAGIKLQNIIDQELGRILRRNPNAKVKFMSVRPESNATNDSAMQKHYMLVLDYDNSINKGITAIHNDKNGGVIESNGKKYLVIGVAGFAKKNFAQKSLYDVLTNPIAPTYKNSTGEPLGLLVKPKKEFFETHPNERFYVNENLSTEIVPYTLIPGYIVKQGLNDSNTEFRSVRELLADKERNPMGYDMQSVAWGIQELTKFLTVGTSVDNVMVPRNTIRNAGSAFVFIPASNGKLIPSYLKVLKYNEMKDGVLKDKVERLLQDVVSPDYATRYQAVMDLCNIFYFDKDGDNILLKKTKAEVSLVHDGKVQKTFTLDSNFDRMEFMKAIEDMNPRVNITARVLQSQKLLKEYDEAGALMTDIAMFGTAGSSYSIYGLDGEGNMLKPKQIVNEIPKATVNSDFKNENKSQVIYKHQYYTRREDDGMYYLNGEPVTDERIIKQLDYNKMIIDNQLSPIKNEGVWEYFILKEGEHPEAIKVNRNTKEVKNVSEETAKEIIQKIEEETAKKQRDTEAQKQLKTLSLHDVKIDLTGDSETTRFIIDPETGEMVADNTVDETPTTKEEKKTEKKTKEVKRESEEKKEGKMTPIGGNSPSTQTFAELYGKKAYRMNILKLIKGKWKDAPTIPAQLEKFLRDKDVEVDSIGTSRDDIDAWMKTIEDCR